MKNRKKFLQGLLSFALVFSLIAPASLAGASSVAAQGTHEWSGIRSASDNSDRFSAMTLNMPEEAVTPMAAVAPYSAVSRESVETVATVHTQTSVPTSNPAGEGYNQVPGVFHSHLEVAAKEAIGKPTGHIYPSHLEEFTDLSAAGSIADLTGLVYCTSLTWPDVTASPLGSLTDAIPVEFGEVLSGSIESPGVSNNYTFSAEAGDVVLIRMVKTSGDLYPSLRLYAPDGSYVAGDYSSGVSVMVSPTLAQTGQYTLLARDHLGNKTGDYNIYTQRLNNPANAIPVAFGEVVSGSIDLAAEMDTYTFSAEAGDVVLIRMVKTSGDLYPALRLYGPDGTLLASEWGTNRAEITATLAEAGEYTLMVRDYYGDRTGEYGIFFQRLNNPANAIPVAFGEVVSGSIDLAAEMDTYTFSADAGDVVLMRIVRTSGDLYPALRLYGPDGTLLASEWGTNRAEITATLAETGEYTLMVRDYYGGRTGDYNTYLQRLNNPANASAVGFGEVISGSIELAAEMDTYTFSADAGDVVLMRIVRTSGDLYPALRLYGPDGTLLASEWGTNRAEITATLAETGEYTILAHDYSGRRTGSYDLLLGEVIPEILGISPNRGGNAGSVSAVISVVNLTPKTVSLVEEGLPHIEGQDVALIDCTHVGVRFDLRGHEAGMRHLVIKLEDGEEVILADAFTVEEGGEAKLWVNIVGRDLRAGRWGTYRIQYGNSGDIAAHDVILSIKIPKDCEYSVDFPCLEFEDFECDSASMGVQVDDEIVISFWILKLAPSHQSFGLSIKAPHAQIGDEVTIVVELKQVMSTFAETGDIEDIEESPVFVALEEAIEEALLNHSSTTMQTFGPIQAAPISSQSAEVRASLRQGVRMIWDNFFPRYTMVGAGIGWFCGGPIGAIIGATIGSVVDNAHFLWNFLMAYYGLIGDVIPGASARLMVTVVGSWDPNDKAGPAGFGDQHFILPEEPLTYVIYFENLEGATAPAQEVVIIDQLDTNLDWETFSFGDITVAGDTIHILEGSKDVSMTIPMVVEPWNGLPEAESVNLVIEASFNSSTGMIEWRFEGRDTTTGELTDFLIPNKDAPKGEGWVVFTVQQRKGLSTHTLIKNKAAIVFDLNPPMYTSEVFNTVDSDPPESWVRPLAEEQEFREFAVRWDGSDVGSGIRDYSIYVSVDDMPYEPWIMHTVSTSATFVGEHGRTYAFYSIATDNVGHCEDKPAAAEATTTIALLVIPGDANEDGVINALDLAWAARIIAGLEDAEHWPGADANQDGVVDVLDLARIARMIAGLD